MMSKTILSNGRALILLLPLFLIKSLPVQAALPERILTDKGAVTGMALPTQDGTGVHEDVMSYRGIPYAAPPVGELRWRPPQAAAAWQGDRDATTFSAMCAQNFPSGRGNDRIQESGMSEDCLYLNVTSAAQSPEARQPVLVWFHGGSLTSGWGNSHAPNSSPLPRKGVVVVSVNHRLGPLGYFSHPALSAESPQGVSGNYGSLDTIAALQWVQNNISAFGGDPDRVTIAGVSGGGEKVLFLMASPLAEGLFHRALVMSGGIANVPLERTEQAGVDLLSRIGIDSSEQTLERLRATSWQDLVTTAASREGRYRSVFTLDNWSLQGLAAQHDVPIILGLMGSEKEPDTSPPYIARALTPAVEPLSDVYAYVFTHLPYGWGSNGGLAYHGGDVSYLFGVLENIAGHYGNLFRPGPRQDIPADPGLDYRDDWVSDAFMSILVKFAETGDPNLDETAFERLGRSWRWPRLDNNDQYLDIGIKPIVKTGWVRAGSNQRRPRYEE